MKLHQLPKLIGIIIYMTMANSCSYKTLPTAEVNYLSGKEGTITMRAIGIGVNTEDAINDAEKNALNILRQPGLAKAPRHFLELQF